MTQTVQPARFHWLVEDSVHYTCRVGVRQWSWIGGLRTATLEWHELQQPTVLTGSTVLQPFTTTYAF